MELFVFDIDGTLTSYGGELKPLETKGMNAILARGDALAIASGRPLSGVMKYMGYLDTSSNRYEICANGADAFDSDGNKIYEKGLRYSDYLHILKKYWRQGREIYTFVGNTIGAFAKGPWADHEIETSNMPPLRDYSRSPQKPDDSISKVLIACDAEESICVEREIAKDDLESYSVLRSSPYFIEFINKDADKSKAVAFIAAKLGIPFAKVHTFGDNMNDLKMISLFDGTAMGNALDPVKAVAKRITLPVDKDGVGVALRDVFKLS